MTDTGSWDTMGHCDAYRANHNLAQGETNDAWKDYYSSHHIVKCFSF